MYVSIETVSGVDRNSLLRHRLLQKKIRLVANPLRNGGRCEGDCDEDKDCYGSLICFHREKGEYKRVPGCLNGNKDGSRTDYCIDPNDMANIFDQQVDQTADDGNPSLNVVGDNVRDEDKNNEEAASTVIIMEEDKGTNTDASPAKLESPTSGSANLIHTTVFIVAAFITSLY
jgi:hypothetical protein